MCDQTIPYKIGDLVWVYLLDRVWWPGVVVEASNTPESYQEFIKKKKLIAVVHFPNDGS